MESRAGQRERKGDPQRNAPHALLCSFFFFPQGRCSLTGRTNGRLFPLCVPEDYQIYLLSDLTLKSKEFHDLHDNERVAYFSKLKKKMYCVSINILFQEPQREERRNLCSSAAFCLKEAITG